MRMVFAASQDSLHLRTQNREKRKKRKMGLHSLPQCSVLLVQQTGTPVTILVAVEVVRRLK